MATAGDVIRPGIPAGRKVRIAIIGAGNMANTVHYPSLASFDDVEIAAICDVDPERLKTTADKYGVGKRYTDYRKMVEEVAPDAVYAIGQPSQMYGIWLWLLDERQNLCVEKPLGITLHQAEMLAYKAEEAGVITQVSFQRRTCPMVAMLRDECLKRGPIVHAVCEFYKCYLKPRMDPHGHLIEDGVHAVDTIRWLCGGEVVEVQSVARRVGMPDVNFITGTFQFDNGATGMVHMSWSSGRRVFRVEMHAKGIAVDAEHEGKGHLYADGDTTGTEYDTRDVAGSSEFHVFAGFRAKDRQFIDCLKAGRLPETYFGDAAKTMEAAQMLLAQAVLART